MLQQIGKVIVSLMVTNWIYAETVLVFPQVEPFTRRVLQVMRIPTHNEWPQIMNSPDATLLRNDLHGYIEKSSLRDAFVAVGVLDRRARTVALHGIKRLRGEAAPAERRREAPREQAFVCFGFDEPI